MNIINMSGNKFFHLLTEFRNKDTSSVVLSQVFKHNFINYATCF